MTKQEETNVNQIQETSSEEPHGTTPQSTPTEALYIETGLLDITTITKTWTQQGEETIQTTRAHNQQNHGTKHKTWMERNNQYHKRKHKEHHIGRIHRKYKPKTTNIKNYFQKKNLPIKKHKMESWRTTQIHE